MKPVPPDRLRDVVDAVLEALDEGLDGPAVAHILDIGVVRRHTIVAALRDLGVRDVETRDPIEWERALATRP